MYVLRSPFQMESFENDFHENFSFFPWRYGLRYNTQMNTKEAYIHYVFYQSELSIQYTWLHIFAVTQLRESFNLTEKSAYFASSFQLKEWFLFLQSWQVLYKNLLL